jgi:hypothetical protein
MHADDVLASDLLTEWRKDPKNKSVSVPGDDRSPAWTWQTYVYSDGTELVLPSECLMTCLRKAGAMVPSKGKLTFKSLTQSGMMIGSDFCQFTNNGKSIRIADIADMRDLTFLKQVEAVRKLGFDLLVKRAKVGQAKHIRVRPRFSQWQVSGSITVTEQAITPDVLEQLFEIAGRLVGLGDWRPSAPQSPGPYGMFTAQVVAAGATSRNTRRREAVLA